jgi:glycerol-3-phosphate acyltransferase PlsY
VEIFLIPACYLIGSFPVAWIVTKLVTGRDIRTLGSGNVGVMNTALNAARWAGILVFVSEAAKGALAVWTARYLEVSDLWVGAAIVATVVGTRWSIWMRGAGGRGNTTGVAALLLLAWPAVLIGLAIWCLVRCLSHQSFLATRVWILSLPITLFLVTHSWALSISGIGLSAIYLSTHASKTDDHTIIKQRWSSLWAFLTSPRRRIRP